MISTNSSFTQIDFDTESARALAKVYALLLRLAEEREKQKASSENVKDEESVEGDTSVSEKKLVN